MSDEQQFELFQRKDQIGPDKEYIILPKGFMVRSIIWRLVRAIVYLFVFSGIGSSYDNNRDSHWMIPAVIGLVVAHFILNLIWKGFIFNWIYKVSYSKETYQTLRKSGATSEK
ncbi:hypothetical protein [Paenibacillus aestuarii]|uniref:DUF2628 domain-containing protein n=1 Tax=Paenibacillus aestuarii TaxID=516965 RepID=A0ABW0K2V7_9BACL|nr:hypothetical protein [Paenibacillus aestuarii]